LLPFDRKLLVRLEPVFEERTNRRHALDARQLTMRQVQYCIGGKEAQQSIKVTPVRSFIRTAHKLNQIGGRGLLRHRPASIPLTVIVWRSVGSWRDRRVLGRCRGCVAREAMRTPYAVPVRGQLRMIWFGVVAAVIVV